MQSVAQTEPFYLFQKLQKDLTDLRVFDILTGFSVEFSSVFVLRMNVSVAPKRSQKNGSACDTYTLVTLLSLTCKEVRLIFPVDLKQCFEGIGLSRNSLIINFLRS